MQYDLEKLSLYLEKQLNNLEDMVKNPEKFIDADEPKIDPMIDTLKWEIEQTTDEINALVAHNQEFAKTSTKQICRLANILERNDKRELTDFVSDSIDDFKEDEHMTMNDYMSSEGIDPYDSEPSRRWD